jgi:hypothetical protein
MEGYAHQQVDENIVLAMPATGKNFNNGRQPAVHLKKSALSLTHLELQRYFDVHEILNADSARKIHDECSSKLQSIQRAAIAGK